MSFDKDYPNRKDWRKPYYHSKRFDATCRPGGACPWCQRERLYKIKRAIEEFDSKFDDWYSNADNDWDK